MGDSLTNLGFFVIKNRRSQNLRKKQDLGKKPSVGDTDLHLISLLNNNH